MSAFYALLCLGLVGFFVWILWHSNQVVPTQTLPPSHPIVTAPSPASRQPIQPVRPTTPTSPKTLLSANTWPRPVETILEAQVALANQGISSGSIDGVTGSQTEAAMATFQKKCGLAPTGLLDAPTKSQLIILQPATTDYTVTAEDLGRIMSLPKTWLGKSQQSRLDYESLLELLGEKAFSNPQLIRALNPNINWMQVAEGTKVILPRVDYPAVSDKASFIKISLQKCILEAFDSRSNLLAHFPCSIGRIAAKRPVGELHVTTIALDPNYTFDPALFPESPEAQAGSQKLIIPPGPNNPVGVAWIGLDRPGYGIHGTPAPEQVGRTESHGCFRLANWNASYLVKIAWVGMSVSVE